MHIIILGAGISGLTLGWKLKQQLKDEVKLTIIEKSARAGGWIESLRHQGYLFEQGPHSCRPFGTGEETLALCHELGLANELIFASPHAKKRLLWCDGKLRQLPSNPFSLLFNPLTKGLLPALLRDLRTVQADVDDETIASFFSRRLHSNLAERLIDPLMSGIYAGDIHQLSLRSCFPLLYRWERQHGSVLKGAWAHWRAKSKNGPSQTAIFSFRNGMETLPQAIVKQLDASLLLSKEAKEIQLSPTDVKVLCDDQEIRGDLLISTLGAAQLAPLISRRAPTLSHLLSRQQAASLAVVNIGYAAKVLPCEAFGYLIPSQEKQEILGAIWDSSFFPEQNSQADESRLTVMMGGAHRPDLLNCSATELAEVALRNLHRHLGIKQGPDALRIKFIQKAIPQYCLGHHAWKEKILEEAQQLPNMTLCGTSFYGASIGDCVSQSARTAELITLSLHKELAKAILK